MTAPPCSVANEAGALRIGAVAHHSPQRAPITTSGSHAIRRGENAHTTKVRRNEESTALEHGRWVVWRRIFTRALKPRERGVIFLIRAERSRCVTPQPCARGSLLPPL